MLNTEELKKLILEKLEQYLHSHTIGVEEKHKLLTNLKLAAETLYYIEGHPKTINYQFGTTPFPYPETYPDTKIKEYKIGCRSSAEDTWWPK